MRVVVVAWRDLYQTARDRLGSECEARWLVEEVSGSNTSPADTRPVPQRARARFEALTERRASGEPLQYVLGRWGFRHVDLMVDRRVLIPRPETEQVVEAALEELDALDHSTTPTVVDLGTGSGAIALAIASERRGVQVWATDDSGDALAVASANLAGLGSHPSAAVRLVQGSWWDALPSRLQGHIDLAVSNPPYISSAEMDALDPQVRDWEPRPALESGPTGTEAIEAIVAGAPKWLTPTAALVVEIAPHQASAAAAIAGRTGFRHIEVRHDLAGRDRILIAKSLTDHAGTVG